MITRRGLLGRLLASLVLPLSKRKKSVKRSTRFITMVPCDDGYEFQLDLIGNKLLYIGRHSKYGDGRWREVLGPVFGTKSGRYPYPRYPYPMVTLGFTLEESRDLAVNEPDLWELHRSFYV
jgi:hypothetical protein